MTVAETFESMLSNFHPEKADGLNKTLQWNISGNDTEKWAIHVHDQNCELIPGGVEQPDLLFQASEKDWLALSQGELDGMVAFMTGKLKVAGDMGLMMKVRVLFQERHPA
jgi:putative sterol carrier protein